MSRRVGITGLGVVTGLGVGMQPLWDGLVAGHSAIKRITRFDPSGFPCRLAAEVAAFSAKDHVPKHYRKAVKVMSRDVELAVAAAKLAVEDAGLTTRSHLGNPDDTTPEDLAKLTYKPGRLGCHIGAGLIAAETEELSYALASATAGAGSQSTLGNVDMAAWGTFGMENLTPLWLLKYLPNMVACHVTIIHGAEGPSNTITCAEASGLLSMGESLRVIQRGAADIGFAGGAESKLNLMGLLRLDLSGRLAHTGDAESATDHYRPYDAASAAPGGFLGEGAGLLILEAMDQATARGAKIYAEVAGFGAAQSSMWYDEGEADEGMRFAIQAALADADIKADEIDAIVPMALGVEKWDRAEFGAMSAVFGERLAKLPLVTLSGNIGNCSAGAGGIQAAVAAMCLSKQQLPARLHAGATREGANAESAPAIATNLRYVLACSGSLGGQNAALVLKSVPTI